MALEAYCSFAALFLLIEMGFGLWFSFGIKLVNLAKAAVDWNLKPLIVAVFEDYSEDLDWPCRFWWGRTDICRDFWAYFFHRLRNSSLVLGLILAGYIGIDLADLAFKYFKPNFSCFGCCLSLHGTIEKFGLAEYFSCSCRSEFAACLASPSLTCCLFLVIIMLVCFDF